MPNREDRIKRRFENEIVGDSGMPRWKHRALAQVFQAVMDESGKQGRLAEAEDRDLGFDSIEITMKLKGHPALGKKITW